MLFNSLEFALFLPVVFILYWSLSKSNLRLQNSLLLAASYFFYGWWDWRFLSLIAFSSVLDFIIGVQLSKTDVQSRRRLYLLLSICVNIGFLGFFKYFNFFAESFSDAFTLLGYPIAVSRLNIILPVGISFYTFQTLSYSIDVYKRQMEPTRDILAFLTFVSFFPQLVAGPIERAKNLLPQFFSRRVFDMESAGDGLRQILWGLFKKVVIADNCAIFVNDIFQNSASYSGSTLFLGAVFFAFQIYGDFSGYSDIAIGTARLFGFNLMRNFAYPYFSRDIAEFWRRWHISLSTWFRDYLYIPLGGSRGGKAEQIRNIFIIFIVSGFWHGANWTFIVWGALNALYFLPLMLMKKNRSNLDIVAEGRVLPRIGDVLNIIITFSLTTLAWIFFRAENLTAAISYLSGVFSSSFFNAPEILPWDLLLFIFALNLIEWFYRQDEHPLQFKIEKSKHAFIFRYAFMCFLIWSIILWGVPENKEFIYFQF